jgi:hypothetical protein
MDAIEIPKPPKFPLDRIEIVGRYNASGICPVCHSTALRRPFIFGLRYCCNSECFHYGHPIFKD